MNRLELRSVTVRYGEGRHALTAVDGIDLQVPASGTLGLVGESGCGKSTVARSIVGLVPIVNGQLLLDGVDITRRRTSIGYRRKVQMVFQDPYSSLNPRMSVGELVREALGIRGLTPSARESESLRVLELVGLARNAVTRYPHEFSGGQRQRIAIARALALEPEVMVLDEATSALDVSVQATILNLLRALQREFKLSYLFISHDLSVVRYMSDSVSVMYLGRIVESGPASELFSEPRHPYTAALMESIPQLSTMRHPAPLVGEIPDPRNPPRGCRFHTRCPIGPRANPQRVICVEQDPQGLVRDLRHHAACHFPLTESTSGAVTSVASTLGR